MQAPRGGGAARRRDAHPVLVDNIDDNDELAVQRVLRQVHKGNAANGDIAAERHGGSLSRHRANFFRA